MKELINLDLLEKLISIKTTPNNNQAFKQAFKLISQSLPGLQVKTINQFSSNILWSTTKSFSNPDCLLLCHLDVVDAPEDLFRLKIKKDQLLGRGSWDMKGPLTSMISAINLVKKQNQDKNIHLLITTDEETGGLSLSQFMKSFKLKPKVAIVPDASKPFDLVTQQKGPIHLTVEIQGKSAHASRPWQGINPINKFISLSKSLNKSFSELKNNQWSTSVTTTNLISPSSINQIPNKLTATFDIRLAQNNDLKIVKEILKRNHAKIIKTQGDGIVFNQTPSTHHQSWIKITKNLAQKTPKFISSSSASDARHLSKSTSVVLTQIPGSNAHADNEQVSLNGLNLLSNITREFIQTL